ncbi:MAG TPA: endolytic transglycosylase MltG [Xanthomonadales bacterium]|nr:endolytic transglycosylase MltG [Xanthomonadales bacterium]
MRRRGSMRALRTLGVLLFVAGAIAGAWVYSDWARFVDAPLLIEKDAPPFVVESGTSFAGIVAKVRERRLSAAEPLYWRALAERMGVAKALHAGEYELEPGLTPRGLLAKLARGEVVQHRFTIVEGWTFRELRAALAQHEGIGHELDALGDPEIMVKLGAPGVEPEGRFLPETYAYSRGDSDLDVLARAKRAMDEALAAAWAARAADLPLKSPDEALVLASIVEKETGVPAERPRIAGVFARRLKIGMLLQTDPTVIYGLGSAFTGNLTRAHLEADSPYNTYTRAGLPPTPIALPGKAALAAATQPAPGNELYFVARGDGSHEFTASLAAHNAAVAKYQLRRR